MAKDQSPVVCLIQELLRDGTGQLVEDGGATFFFSGASHSAPLDEIALSLHVNTSRKEMPGGNTVVEHAMAATWQPFEINGEWVDMWANRRDSINQVQPSYVKEQYAWRTYIEFSEMVLRSNLVRLQLDSISLVGLITDFSIKYRTSDRIGYSFTLSPHDNESIDSGEFSSSDVESRSIPDWMLACSVESVEIQNALLKAKRLALKKETLVQFTTTLGRIQAALDRVENVIGNGFASDVDRKVLLISSMFRRVRSEALTLATTFAHRRTDLEVAFADALNYARHTEWIMSSLTASWRLAAQSRLAEIDMKRRAGKKPKAIYYPMSGESLERIAIRFYGTPDAWRTIYDANHLDTLVLDGTEELVIPQRRSA